MATAKKADLKIKSTNFTDDDGKLIYLRAHYDHMDGKPLGYPPTAHDHLISEVTGLQTALNGKLNLSGGTMTGPITMGSNNITGNNSSIFQAGRIIATNSSTSAHGITSSGSRANMLYLMNGVTGGLAASLLDVDVNNGTTPQKRIAKIGIYGGATSGTGGTPSATYLWLSSVEDNTYNKDATLKVDSQNRVGIAISGANRPTQALDVDGKIRMRTATVDADGDDIVVTKGYMLSKIESDTNNYLTNVSGSGNGTVTFTREGLGNLTWDATHDHNSLYNTKAEITSLLAGKENSITGAATTITSNNLTANRALISNGSGKVAVSAVTSTELGYLGGVTSGIQTQLNGKVSLSGAETISGIKTFNDGIIIPGSTSYIDIGEKTNWFWTRFSGENWTFYNTYLSGGWARNLMEMKDDTKPTANTYFRIGAQGNGQNFTHMYIGPAFNNYWLSLNGTRALFKTKPQYESNPTDNNDLTRKAYVDSNFVATSNIANNLTTTDAGKVLDARQGKILNDGKQDKLLRPVSSHWWESRTPMIGNDGVMEIGKYIDFHITNGGTTDYDQRLEADATGLKLGGHYLVTAVNVANNLNTTDSGKVLDARQGKALNDAKQDKAPTDGKKYLLKDGGLVEFVGGSGNYSETTITTLTNNSNINLSSLSGYKRIRLELYVYSNDNTSSTPYKYKVEEFYPSNFVRKSAEVKQWTSSIVPGITYAVDVEHFSIINPASFLSYLNEYYPAAGYNVGDWARGRKDSASSYYYARVTSSTSYKDAQIDFHDNGKFATISATQAKFTAPTTSGVTYRLKIIGINF